MGYRDDFYTAINLIGHTGDLNGFPSVYFQSATEYGHITQEHGSSQNVGRAAVKSSAGYTIGNELVDGEQRCVERRNGNKLHTSRNTFIPVTDQTRGTLLQAIAKYENEKYITSFNAEVRATITTAKNAKNQAMAQILQLPRVN